MEPVFSLVDNVCWHGHSAYSCISMSTATFDRYLAVYIDEMSRRQPGIGSREQGMQRVRQLSYWAYGRYDKSIRTLPLPRCILTEGRGRV
jgi:hypothetical protein